MHKTYGTGRRKTSSARVYLYSGTGEIKIIHKKLMTLQNQPHCQHIC